MKNGLRERVFNFFKMRRKEKNVSIIVINGISILGVVVRSEYARGLGLECRSQKPTE